MPEDPLALDPERMRQLGYRTVDRLVDRITDPQPGPALRRATPAEMRARIGGDPPEHGEPFEQLLEQLWTDVLPFASRCEHPRYFAFIPASGTWPGALGDFIAAALNPYVGSWMEAAGPSQIELEVIRWFCRWIGFPEAAAGILVSGGSAANMTALACAREARLGMMSDTAVAYVSDQAHSSLARAARVLGFRPGQVRVLPVDSRFRIRPGQLEDAIAADLRMGRTPLFVNAVAGATNTGAIDPLEEIADICSRRGVWMHVDAAYGGFAGLTERGAAALSGIERADSVTLDPHKWLYQPFECGCVLVRDPRLLRRAFEITPDYLRDAVVQDQEVNFADLGMQLSRGFRALKIWLSVRSFGIGAFRQAIDRCLDLALAAEQRIRADPRLELLSPASLGVVCFRRRSPELDDQDRLDEANSRLVARYADSGEGLLSSTRLRGVFAVRLCVLNHASTAADVEAVLDWFTQAELETATPAAASAEPPVPDRHPSVDLVLGASGVLPTPVPLEEQVPEDALRDASLFAVLDEDQLLRVRWVARELRVPAGAALIEQWDLGSDFYVVLGGTARVIRDGVQVDELGPGDFFGEFAALQWGASFSYSRLATVIADTPMQLAVLTAPALASLMVELPELDRRITRVRRDRLARMQTESGSGRQ
jgi:aromatic-L-amino-acid decarboxylase